MNGRSHEQSDVIMVVACSVYVSQLLALSNVNNCASLAGAQCPMVSSPVATSNSTGELWGNEVRRRIISRGYHRLPYHDDPRRESIDSKVVKRQ